MILILLIPSFFLAISLLLKKNIIVVYQVGKVASSTAMATLKNNNVTAIQVHWATPSGVINLLAEHAKHGFKVPRHIINTFALNFLKSLGKKKINYLILTRFPSDRNISAFYQNKYDSYNSLDIDNAYGIKYDDMLDEFLLRYKHWIPENWLLNDFCVFFNISSKDLIHKLKHKSSFTIGNSKLAFHSINSDSDLLLKALNKLGEGQVQLIKLVTANIAKDKDYSSVYDEMKSRIAKTDYKNYMNIVNPQYTALNKTLLKKP